jgi:fatty-acyl-CoA synthase
LSKDSDTTSTFKFKKTNLVKAGFDPANISEPLYFADPATGEFAPIDADIFKGITDGSVRL